MKTGLESVKAALRSYFNSAAEDLEKTQENLKLGQFTHSREQPRGVTQIINYTTFALLPVLSSLFEHIGQNMFGEDLIRAYRPLSLRRSMNEPIHLEYQVFKCFWIDQNVMTQTLHCFSLLSPVDDVQVSCYRILNSLYFLGTNKSIYVERYNMSDTPV